MQKRSNPRTPNGIRRFFVLRRGKENYSALEVQYNELKAFKDNYDATQLKAEKDAVLEAAEYAEIKKSDEFKALGL